MAKNDKKPTEVVEPKTTEELTNTPEAADEAEKPAEEDTTDPEAEAEATPAKEEPKQAKAEAEAEAESTEGLVKMHKDGTYLHVHPTTVEAHKAAGWKHA